VSGFALTLSGKAALFLVPLALLAAYFAYRRTTPAVAGPLRARLTALRAAALLLLVAALCEPVAVLTREVRGRPVVALLLDASRSMEIADVPAAGGSRGARRDAAIGLLEGGGLQSDLAERNTVVPFLFGGESVAGADSKTDLGGLADATDLAAALGGARQAGDVDAVVIVSDGVRTAGGDPVAAARAFGHPVFAIGVGDPAPAKDLAVTGILASEVVYAGVPSPIVATLRGRGLRGQRFEALLEENGAVLARDSVRFPEGSEVAEVRFRPSLDGEGVRRLTVRLPTLPDEATAENNAQSVAVKLLKKKIGVLVLFGRPEYDMAFVRRALAAEEGIEVDAWFADATGTLRKGAGAHAPPAGAISEEVLYRYDAVVLGAPSSAVFRQLSPRLLASFVERREGALVVIAGDQGFRGIPPEVWPLLPAAPPSERGAPLATRPVVAALSIEGEGHPLTRLLPEADANRALWRSLPPLAGVAALGEPRADAVILAYGRERAAAAPSADPAAETGVTSGAPLLLISRRGGRALLVAGRGVWRWEFLTWGAGRSGDAPAHLWGNAIRWLVSRDEFKRTEVRPEAPSFRRGERVRFFARVLDENYRPVDDAALRVTLTRADDSTFSAEVSLASSGVPGEYRGAAADLAPGLYRFRGDASRQGLSLGSDKGEVVVSERSPEFEETTMDEATLRAMADASGGRYVSLADYKGGALGIDLPERTRDVRREIPLWNHPLLFLAMVGLFVTEWWVRKRRDLP